MSLVGFEPTIAAFDQAKTAHALDRAAAVIGSGEYSGVKMNVNVMYCVRMYMCAYRVVLLLYWAQIMTETKLKY
jgi:hypothetical protein